MVGAVLAGGAPAARSCAGGAPRGALTRFVGAFEAGGALHRRKEVAIDGSRGGVEGDLQRIGACVGLCNLFPALQTLGVVQLIQPAGSPVHRQLHKHHTSLRAL